MDRQVSVRNRLIERCLLAVRRILEGSRWDSNWSDEQFGPYWMQAGVHPEVIRAVERGWFSPPGKVLELGCGIGRDSAWLASRGFDVLGVDLSRVAVDKACQQFGDFDRLKFLAADVCGDSDLGGPFDFILDVGCLLNLGTISRPAYGRNLRTWVGSGTRMLLVMNAKDTTPEERLVGVRELVGSAAEVVDWRVVEIQGPNSDEVVRGPVFDLRFN